MEKLVYTHLCHTGRWFNMHIRRTNVARKSNAVIRAPNSTQLNWFWNCSELNSTLWSSPLSAELSWALWSLLETPVPISDTDGVCASRLPTTMCNACARHRRRWRRQKTTSKKNMKHDGDRRRTVVFFLYLRVQPLSDIGCARTHNVAQPPVLLCGCQMPDHRVDFFPSSTQCSTHANVIRLTASLFDPYTSNISRRKNCRP